VLLLCVGLLQRRFARFVFATGCTVNESNWQHHFFENFILFPCVFRLFRLLTRERADSAKLVFSSSKLLVASNFFLPLFGPETFALPKELTPLTQEDPTELLLSLLEKIREGFKVGVSFLRIRHVVTHLHSHCWSAILDALQHPPCGHAFHSHCWSAILDALQHPPCGHAFHSHCWSAILDALQHPPCGHAFHSHCWSAILDAQFTKICDKHVTQLFPLSLLRGTRYTHYMHDTHDMHDTRYTHDMHDARR
jgi:hypothetical protein